jgi:hypothetical protein
LWKIHVCKVRNTLSEPVTRRILDPTVSFLRCKRVVTYTTGRD